MDVGAIVSSDELDRHWQQDGLAALFKDIAALGGAASRAFEPAQRDLARLHLLIRKRRFLTTVKFGVGYSTIVMAHAHSLNKQDFKAARVDRKLRNTHLFEHVAVDASQEWLDSTARMLPESLKPFVTFHRSDVQAGLYQGQLSHTYSALPNVIADFIYLDGPDPKDVKGSVNGLDFSIAERTVMSADLLVMESCFLPGTAILVDGRTNNARFLERNFRRTYKITWDREGDCTLFELQEPRLGPHNVLGPDIF